MNISHLKLRSEKFGDNDNNNNNNNNNNELLRFRPIKDSLSSSWRCNTYSLKNPEIDSKSSHSPDVTMSSLVTAVYFVWFQASTAKYKGSTLFWKTAQRIVIIPCRRFGTTYRSHLQGPRSQRRKPFFFYFLTFEDGTDRLSRNVGKELSLYVTQFPTRAQISFISRQKPGISQSPDIFPTNIE